MGFKHAFDNEWWTLLIDYISYKNVIDITDIIQSFNTDWLKVFDFLHRSKKGEQYAFFMFCHTDFSISHGGENDIEKYRDTEKHGDSYKRRFQQSTLKTMFNKDSGGMEDKVC